MSILEKEVWVGLKGKSIKYYESLGYKIPRYMDNQGRLKIKESTRILVKVEDLAENSEIKLTKICDNCGTKCPNQTHQMIIRYRRDGKDECKKCSRILAANSRRNNLKYENSFEFWAIDNRKGYMLNEYSNKNHRKPTEISKATHDIFWWNCPNCNSEYDMRMCYRTIGESNCPYCAGERVNHTNCLWTTHPEIAGNLLNKQQGFDFTRGMAKKLKFACSDCGNEFDKLITVAVRDGLNCPRCSDGISYPEKFILNLFLQLNIDFEYQKSFKWSNRKKYDFYIPDLKCIIETHGSQHYIDKGFGCLGGRTLEEEEENDKTKMELAQQNLIKHYIIIDCRNSNMEWIKENVINSDLAKLLNFNESVVDWFKCHESSCNSLVKISSGLWGHMKSASRIAMKLKINATTVRKYLIQGRELGWCDYDPVKSQSNNGARCGRGRRIKIIQLSLGGEFIKEWNSAIEIKKALGIDNTRVAEVCKGKLQTTRKYKWMYKEDYEKYISQAI